MIIKVIVIIKLNKIKLDIHYQSLWYYCWLILLAILWWALLVDLQLFSRNSPQKQELLLRQVCHSPWSPQWPNIPGNGWDMYIFCVMNIVVPSLTCPTPVLTRTLLVPYPSLTHPLLVPYLSHPSPLHYPSLPLSYPSFTPLNPIEIRLVTILLSSLT